MVWKYKLYDNVNFDMNIFKNVESFIVSFFRVLEGWGKNFIIRLFFVGGWGKNFYFSNLVGYKGRLYNLMEYLDFDECFWESLNDCF